MNIEKKTNDLAAQLSDKLQDKNREIIEMKNLHERDIARLKEENRKLLKQKILLEQDSVSAREILKLAAHGYNIKNIHDILTREKGLDLSVDEVKLTVDKIDLLPDDLYKYYLGCKKDFKDKVSIDSGFFTNAIYKKYMLLENTVSYQLARAEEAGDEKLITSCVGQLTTIYDKMTTAFAKNGMSMQDDKSIEDLMSGYEESKETKIIKFSQKLVSGMEVM